MRLLRCLFISNSHCHWHTCRELRTPSQMCSLRTDCHCCKNSLHRSFKSQWLSPHPSRSWRSDWTSLHWREWFSAILKMSLPILHLYINRYLKFCSSVSVLANEGFQHQMLKCYLSALRYAQIARGLQNPFAEASFPRLECVLKGVKNTRAKGEARRSHAYQ